MNRLLMSRGLQFFYSEQLSNLKAGNHVKVLGSREEVNGSIRLNADTVIILNNNEVLPEDVFHYTF